MGKPEPFPGGPPGVAIVFPRETVCFYLRRFRVKNEAAEGAENARQTGANPNRINRLEAASAGARNPFRDIL